MDIQMLLGNLAHPPILFFAVGLLVVAVRLDLEIPPQIAKFFTLYLLFDIGFKGNRVHQQLSDTARSVR